MNVWTFFVGKKDEKFMLSVAEVSPIIRTKSPNESSDFFCGQKEREVYSGYSINVTENLIATDSQTLIFRIFESMAIFI
jgi:hypothetical protein